eukprot:CAMPEP_0202007800 /NCGR_PEP_ID=MMETSP0905-20130828/12178_1 /ASSEMBLY_ACC=CAM_ASM_000554 /TAXON_ID=420261 /ORGANISM="Thalassiosira antarctica, Strain CCMP982" /LENGTH=35 /DNA_ID= /DNA_START= /DNA_END= /DNA_ORIENTATION=
MSSALGDNMLRAAMDDDDDDDGEQEEIPYENNLRK